MLREVAGATAVSSGPLRLGHPKGGADAARDRLHVFRERLEAARKNIHDRRQQVAALRSEVDELRENPQENAALIAQDKERIADLRAKVAGEHRANMTREERMGAIREAYGWEKPGHRMKPQ